MMSQIQGKQLCRPNELFVVVLEKRFVKNEISPFGVDFEICNFVDRFMPKHTHYTLNKIQKVKKHNRTPLSKWPHHLLSMQAAGFQKPQVTDLKCSI